MLLLDKIVSYEGGRRRNPCMTTGKKPQLSAEGKQTEAGENETISPFTFVSLRKAETDNGRSLG